MMKIKINKDFAKVKAGDVVNVPDHDGVPTENFWRRRLRDSAIDGCCEIIKDEAEKMSFAKSTNEEGGE